MHAENEHTYCSNCTSNIPVVDTCPVCGERIDDREGMPSLVIALFAMFFFLILISYLYMEIVL